MILTFLKFNSNIFIDFSGSRMAVYLKGKKTAFNKKKFPSLTSHFLCFCISSQYQAVQNSHVLFPCSTLPFNSSLATYFTKYGKTPSPNCCIAMDSVARAGHSFFSARALGSAHSVHSRFQLRLS